MAVKVLGAKESLQAIAGSRKQLNLTAREGFERFYQFAGDLYGRDENGEPNCIFDKEADCGAGHVTPYSDGTLTVTVGVKEFFQKPPLVGNKWRDRGPDEKINDELLVGSIHAACHEYQHVRQLTDPYTPKDVSVSMLSIGAAGGDYYDKTWSKYPSEIDADYVGFNMAWDTVESMFPEKGAAVMNRYLNNSAGSGFVCVRNQKSFGMTGMPISRDQMNLEYYAAYDRALKDNWPAVNKNDLYPGSPVALLAHHNPAIGEWFEKPHPGKEMMQAMAAAEVAMLPSKAGAVHRVISRDELSLDSTIGISCPQEMNNDPIVVQRRKQYTASPVGRAAMGNGTPVMRGEHSEEVTKALNKYQNLEQHREVAMAEYGLQ